jgi:light-regulated signal transduction histidine kinase (bacteriophytochrome)
VDADRQQKPAVEKTDPDRGPSPITAVQPFGFLVAVSHDWLVLRASTNAEDHLGIPAQEMLGKPLREIFNPEIVHAIRNRMMLLRERDAIERMFSLALCDNRRPFDVAVHFFGSAVIIEAEPTAGGESEVSAIVRVMVMRLQKAGAMGAFLTESARHVRALTGFDRVTIYRFNETGGAAVAEAVRTGIDSVLGQDTPAAVLPAAFRALFLRNSIRIIADIRAAPVRVLPEDNASGIALDRTLCILQPQSPAEHDYMRRLGVEASFSSSIVSEGQLWGLFVCHHYKPRLPNFAQRGAVELFAQMFALMLNGREAHEQLSLLTAASERRLRGTLSLLRALIAETRQDASSADALADALDGRIAALAREHDNMAGSDRRID